ncbi:MAG: RAMP superfamily CRISPR-associated protein [Thermogemmata sp.]|nr:RAMP superfamily CRISPR-associated protein [Thermogemmata sp.]
MAREIYSRIHLHGVLVAQSPLHVGGFGDDIDTDLPLARDGAGQFYVPGTSLAGALREYAERLFGQGLTDELWGCQDRDLGHASYVLVEDALIANADQIMVEIRDHVGIDRQYGCAAEHIKFDRAILPRGTRLIFHLIVEVENRSRRDQVLAMVDSLRQALERGEIRLGAATTRGLGHLRLEETRLSEQVLGTRVGILAALSSQEGTAVSPADLEAAGQRGLGHPPPRLRLEIAWQPAGPLMVKAGFEGIAVDMLPLVSGVNGHLALVLPGSSVKGSLRTQAERIVRTLRADLHPCWLNEGGKRKFLEAVRLPLIDELFGQAGQRLEDGSAATSSGERRPSWLPGRGALSVRDCYGVRRLSPAQWQAIQAAENDEQLRRALRAAGLGSWSQAYHVAIDRWLGCAAESMLYTVLEPLGTQWEPLVLELDLQRLPDTTRYAALALLLLTLRDLIQGRLPLGFATHRGMGAVQVTGLQVQGYGLHPPLSELDGIALREGRLQNVPSFLKDAWTAWVRQPQEA